MARVLRQCLLAVAGLHVLQTRRALVARASVSDSDGVRARVLDRWEGVSYHVVAEHKDRAVCDRTTGWSTME